MFTSALVAVDLSPAEQPLLDCIPDLMKWGINKVTLIHVMQLSYNRFVSYGHEDDYRAWLEKGADPLRQAGLDVNVAVCNSGGSVADQVLEAADEVDADLIVIGSRGHTRLRSLFLGSVAREVIHKASRPVLLEWVEPNADESHQRFEAVCTHTLDHILLATDLSKYATAAERALVGLAPKALQTDILTVLTPYALVNVPAWPLMVNAALEDLRKRLLAQSVQVSLLMQEGKPSDTIAQVAANRICTLIIVGKQGHGQQVSKVIGSTAARICETARRPVLMVPFQERGARLTANNAAQGTLNRILFVCVGNSARSQMAEGFARKLLGPRIEVVSAGSELSDLNPHAVAAMKDVDIDISHQYSKHINDIDICNVDLVITLSAEEVCPSLPGHIRRLYWPIADPSSSQPKQTEQEIAVRYAAARDAIRMRVEILAGMLDRLG